MIWYKHLIVGKKAKQRKHHVIGKIKRNEYQHQVYVITLAESGNNHLEIYPSFVLLQDYYQSKEFTIVGLAIGYDEALEVVRQRVESVYNQTGGVDIKTSFK